MCLGKQQWLYCKTQSCSNAWKFIRNHERRWSHCSALSSPVFLETIHLRINGLLDILSQYSQLPRPAVHERADAGPVLCVGYDEPEYPGRGTHTAESIVLSAIQPQGESEAKSNESTDIDPACRHGAIESDRCAQHAIVCARQQAGGQHRSLSFVFATPHDSAMFKLGRGPVRLRVQTTEAWPIPHRVGQLNKFFVCSWNPFCDARVRTTWWADRTTG